MLRRSLYAGGVMLAAVLAPNEAAWAKCPVPVEQCVARCVANDGQVAKSGKCGPFCQNRACMSGGAAKAGGGGGGGVAAEKRGDAQRRAGRGGEEAQQQGRSRAQPFLRAGRDLMQEGKIQAAIAEFEKAVRADPKWPGSYVALGTALNRVGLYRKAIVDFDKALELDPRNFGALVSRGAAYRSVGDSGRALADLNAAGEINPSAGEPYAFRAMVYSSQGDQERALKEANTAVQLNPRFFQSYGALGIVRSAMRDYDKAVEAYDKALAMVPHFGNLYGRGVALQNLGESERALADFNASLAINPNNAAALVNRARIFTERGQLEPAMADLNLAVRNSPKNVFALLQRAKVQEMSKNFAAARDDFAAVLTQFPSHGVATAGVERTEARLAGKDAPMRNRSGGRVALVIANARYAVIDNLANTERDAKLMVEALQKTGFEKVEMLVDGSRESISARLKSFTEAAANADWAVVYYAGHGIEVEGTNYLVPVDAKYEQDADVPKESVALDQVLNAVGVASKLRLVILDACRDNPFKDMKRTSEASVGRGLARIEPESGTLVAFATKHGRTASDGSGQNSPFATALARRVQTPGLEVNQIFRLVHDEVLAETDKQQEPFTYGQLPAQQFYFRQ